MTAGAVEIRYSKPVEFPKVLTVERGYAPLKNGRPLSSNHNGAPSTPLTKSKGVGLSTLKYEKLQIECS